MKRLLAKFFIGRTVRRAVAILRSHPNSEQDEVLRIFRDAGLSAEEAWRAYQFIPIAFCHVVLRHKVRFSTSYISLSYKTNEKITREFQDEPFYQAAKDYAKRLIAGEARYHDLLPVFGVSAEFHAINRVLEKGGNLEGIEMGETAIFTYEA